MSLIIVFSKFWIRKGLRRTVFWKNLMYGRISSCVAEHPSICGGRWHAKGVHNKHDTECVRASSTYVGGHLLALCNVIAAQHAPSHVQHLKECVSIALKVQLSRVEHLARGL